MASEITDAHLVIVATYPDAELAQQHHREARRSRLHRLGLSRGLRPDVADFICREGLHNA